MRILGTWIVLFIFVAAGVGWSGCSPTVQVAAPTEPITINLNVKIEHEIIVKVDKDLDELFSDDELF
jgi:hypothetical protein